MRAVQKVNYIFKCSSDMQGNVPPLSRHSRMLVGRAYRSSLFHNKYLKLLLHLKILCDIKYKNLWRFCQKKNT